MTGPEIAILVMQAITLVITALTPIIMAVSEFIRRIERSTCFGSGVELHDAKSFNNKIQNSEIPNVRISSEIQHTEIPRINSDKSTRVNFPHIEKHKSMQ